MKPLDQSATLSKLPQSKGIKAWVKSWVKKHHASITFAGASIILMTYLCKEWLRESAKDASDEVVAVVNVFEVRADLLSLDMRHSGLERDWNEESDDLLNVSQAKAAYAIEEKRRNSLWTEGREMLHTIDDYMENEDIKGREEDWYQFNKRATTIKSMCDDKSNHSTDYDCLTNKIIQLRMLISDMQSNLQKQKEDTLQKLTADKRHKDSCYKFWTKASRILYLTGWLLALIGNLSGVKLTASE